MQDDKKYIIISFYDYYKQRYKLDIYTKQIIIKNQLCVSNIFLFGGGGGVLSCYHPPNIKALTYVNYKWIKYDYDSYQKDFIILTQTHTYTHKQNQNINSSKFNFIDSFVLLFFHLLFYKFYYNFLKDHFVH